MPYGNASAYWKGDRLIIEIEVPSHGELSLSGRAENLTNPPEWIEPEGDDSIGIKLAVCRRLRRGRR